MERNSNLGYMAVKVQGTNGLTVDAVPDVFLPIYSADIATTANFQTQNPIIGNKFGRRSTLRGLRDHTGSITVEGEPNTVAVMYDMLMTRGTESGSDPYTQPYTFSKTADPKPYTIDISYVSHVVRYIGVQASAIEDEWEDNELRLNVSVSALKVWDGRAIASVASQVITFAQDYDRSPTDGLFAGDLLQYFDASSGTYSNLVVSSVDDGTDITVTGTVPTPAAGDFVTLRPVTAPSFSTLPTFTWANTEFRFGATASAALSATHTPLEQDTSIAIQHPFEDDAGAKRSGSHDPASLPRMLGMFEYTTKKYFDTPEEMQRYSQMEKRACVVRHFAYSGANTYEYRQTLNNLTQNNPRPTLSGDEILYSEIENMGNYDSSDAQGIGVTVISGTQLE